MLNPQAETLIITSKCSGGCTPCPFGSGLLPQRFLPAEQIVERLRSSEAPLVVLTGGEPLEHPDFLRLVGLIESEMARESLAPFRIATGGHIAFSLCLLERLKRIPSFTGVSLGTDVLTEVCSRRADHSVTWKSNVELFNAMNVCYSLTLTTHKTGSKAACEIVSSPLPVGAQFDDSFALLLCAVELGAQPEFIYLRTAALDSMNDELVKIIKDQFAGAQILIERI
jgi:hypothetical protein